MQSIRRLTVSAFAVLLMWPLSFADAMADTLAKPQGPVVLTVSGEIAKTNVAGEAWFDREMLRGIGVASFTTTTIWTDGPQTFTGTPFHLLLDTLGVSEGTLTATALNDYAIELPVADLAEGHALLAFELNGRTMSVREKGPLWVVYPYDSAPRFQSEVYHSRSIWQLDRLKVSR